MNHAIYILAWAGVWYLVGFAVVALYRKLRTHVVKQ